MWLGRSILFCCCVTLRTFGLKSLLYCLTHNRFIFTHHSCTGRYCWVRARISYGNSVRPSVCPGATTRYRTKPRWDRDSGSSPYDSLESLVSNEVILVLLGEEIPLERGHQRGGTPVRNRYFTTIGSSSVKTVEDRHRLAAYRNKHCRRPFQRYQHRWPWTTLNPKNRDF